MKQNQLVCVKNASGRRIVVPKKIVNKKTSKKVQKTNGPQMADDLHLGQDEIRAPSRGIAVVNTTDFLRMTGRTDDGNRLDVNIERAWLTMDGLSNGRLNQSKKKKIKWFNS
jgi:hypothetical protein